MTWEELVVLEPRLEALLAEVKSVRGNYHRRIRMWYVEPNYKGLVTALVGQGAKNNPALKTHEAYDIAYQTLVDALLRHKRSAPPTPEQSATVAALIQQCRKEGGSCYGANT